MYGGKVPFAVCVYGCLRMRVILNVWVDLRVCIRLCCRAYYWAMQHFLNRRLFTKACSDMCNLHADGRVETEGDSPCAAVTPRRKKAIETKENMLIASSHYHSMWKSWRTVLITAFSENLTAFHHLQSRLFTRVHTLISHSLILCRAVHSFAM